MLELISEFSSGGRVSQELIELAGERRPRFGFRISDFGLGLIRMARVHLALSLKQPWATLLVHGRKTIEVRRWPTKQRGRILIHAARIPDPRPEAWAFVSKELWPLAQQVGGIIGVGELTECLSYRSLENFTMDREKHLNDPAWFQGPVMYGFLFSNLKALPFRRYPGWMRFFEVEPSALRGIDG
jgi:hypothetical protein